MINASRDVHTHTKYHTKYMDIDMFMMFMLAVAQHCGIYSDVIFASLCNRCDSN